LFVVPSFNSGKGWNNKQRRILQQLAKDNVVNRIASNTAHAEQVTRIFEDGKKSNGANIGKYKNDSYKKLRAQKGRETGFINLRLSGALQIDYSNGLKTTKKDSQTQVVLLKSNRNAVIVEAQEKRFGDIFELTKEEVDLFINTTTRELQLLLG